MGTINCKHVLTIYLTCVMEIITHITHLVLSPCIWIYFCSWTKALFFSYANVWIFDVKQFLCQFFYGPVSDEANYVEEQKHLSLEWHLVHQEVQTGFLCVDGCVIHFFIISSFFAARWEQLGVCHLVYKNSFAKVKKSPISSIKIADIHGIADKKK